jgi:hypothetical protein
MSILSVVQRFRLLPAVVARSRSALATDFGLDGEV